MDLLTRKPMARAGAAALPWAKASAAIALPMAAAIALSAAEADAAAPAAWENPPAIPAESDLFQDRLLNPQAHFLLDGQHAWVAGKEFHQAIGEPMHFLWTAHPWMRLGPDRRWLKDSAEVTYRLLVGNEVGDPLFQELSSDRDFGNRTPLTAGGVSWSPTGEWSVNAALDQNDHFSYRTFPDRLAIVGEARRDQLSYVGGNLPPRSVSQLGGALFRHGGLMAAQVNYGWWWTNSPVSGMPYAWQGFNADFFTRAGDDFDLTLSDQSWQGPSPEAFQASRWRRTELTLGFSGGAPGGWRWRLELGGQRRALYSDSAFVQFEEDTYPWRFRYRQVWSPERAAYLQLEHQGNLGARERMFSGQHMTELRQTWGRHGLSQGVKGYYRRPFDTYRQPVEILDPDTAWTATLIPDRHARGISGSGGYRYTRNTFHLALSGHYAAEWGVPVFRGGVVDTLETLRIRAGTLEGSEHHYANFGGEAEAGGSLGQPAFWRLQGGWRGFEGRAADEVEFRPSPWWVGGGLGFRFPSDLRIESMVHWVGPKEVRGWGEDFETPAHFEGNAALVQSLFQRRLELSAAFLHALGDEVLEHPNGNPLLFRIVVGAKGWF